MVNLLFTMVDFLQVGVTDAVVHTVSNGRGKGFGAIMKCYW